MSLATVTSGLDRKTIKFAHTAAVVALTVLLLRSRVLVPLNDTDAAADNLWVFEGLIEHAKAAVTILAGETAYWDDTAKVFTNVVGTNTKCGVFTEDAASGTAVAQIYLTNEVNL